VSDQSQIAVAIAKLEGKSEAVDQRMNDITARLGDINAKNSVWLAVLSILVTVLIGFVGAVGVLTYMGAREKAGDEAKAWLEDNKKEVLGPLQAELQKHADKIKGQMDAVTAGVEKQGQEAMRRIEASFAAGPANRQAKVGETDKKAMKQADKAVAEKPENQYTADDWRTRGLAAVSEGKYEDAVAYFTKIVDAPDATRDQVAKALYNRGVGLGRLGRHEAEITSYDEVIRRFGGASEPALREMVAMALVNKGFRLGALGRGEAAIASYDEVIHRFGDASEPALREQVAKALVGNGGSLGQLGRHEAAIAICDEVICRFGGASEPALREMVAMALFNKGLSLGALGRGDVAIASFDEVLRRFGAATEPALKEQVAKARKALGK
jgi:tetratricopeptide (TPR) repeat protein